MGEVRGRGATCGQDEMLHAQDESLNMNIKKYDHLDHYVC